MTVSIASATDGPQVTLFGVSDLSAVSIALTTISYKLTAASEGQL